jgi:hypothetical protein
MSLVCFATFPCDLELNSQHQAADADTTTMQSAEQSAAVANDTMADYVPQAVPVPTHMFKPYEVITTLCT